MKVKIHCFLISSLDRGKWLFSLPERILPPKEPPIFIKYKAVRAPGRVWTFWKKWKCIVVAGIWTEDRPAHSLVSTPTVRHVLKRGYAGIYIPLFALVKAKGEAFPVQA